MSFSIISYTDILFYPTIQPQTLKKKNVGIMRIIWSSKTIKNLIHDKNNIDNF